MTKTIDKMDEFERLLEESFAKSHTVADIVEGTIIRKEQEGYLVCVKGAKTEAFLSKNEIPSENFNSADNEDTRQPSKRSLNSSIKNEDRISSEKFNSHNIFCLNIWMVIVKLNEHKIFFLKKFYHILIGRLPISFHLN